MITEDKVIEIFYMADEYSKEFPKSNINIPSGRDAVTAGDTGTSRTA